MPDPSPYQSENALSAERQSILDTAKKEDELSNLKQHANKMIQGFGKFDSNSPGRAIWELVQNACDLSNECEVTLDYSGARLTFSHNGRLFDSNSLISLIKQVSAKEQESDGIAQVGKYGTGFLTTHSFGRKFLLNSYIQAQGLYFEVREFLIDRSPKTWQALSDNIFLQKEDVFKLLQEGKTVPEPSPYLTTFTYLPETEQEHKNIEISRDELKSYIPWVMTINERLKTFTEVNQNGEKTIFCRKSKSCLFEDETVGLHKTEIGINDKVEVIFSLVAPKEEIEVILPINQAYQAFQFPVSAARMFLYYPLIGSHTIGFNYIVNCNHFLPTEPRDTIHLMSDTDQVKDDEEKNRQILDKVSILILNFLRSEWITVNKPVYLAKINFKRDFDKPSLNQYFEGLQKKWRESFTELPLVETSKGFITPSECYFLHGELLTEEMPFDSIYNMVSKFDFDLPNKDEARIWSLQVAEWGTDESIRFIDHKTLLNEISQRRLQLLEAEELRIYYKSLIDCELKGLFTNLKLIPNTAGDFHNWSDLLAPIDLTNELIGFANTLIPETMSMIAHPDFRFDFELEKFNRKSLSNKVREALEEIDVDNTICLPQASINEEYTDISETSIKKLDHDLFIALLSYCKLHSNVDSQSKPSSLIKLISRYYGESDALIHLESLQNQDKNIELRSSRKIFVQIFLNLLSFHTQEWVNANLALLYEIATYNEDSYKDIYASAAIFPNQIDQLKPANELLRDNNLDPDIVALYNRVKNTEIRSKIIYPDFNEFIAEDHFYDNQKLANEIQDTFFETEILKINDHPFKEEIIHLIFKLEDPHYAKLFDRLDSKKATLMLEVVTNEDTKDDIFSIVKLPPDQINKLGELLKDNKFDDLFNTVADVIHNETIKKVDFRHKYEIGTRIEQLIFSELSSELQQRVAVKAEKEIATSSVQGGQDIIIYLDDEPFYFIEVKSRWNNRSSVAMSKRQLETAVKESNRYALCSVDITKYAGNKDKYTLNIEDILPLVKVVTGIGKEIEVLIRENIHAELNTEDSIHLVDFRGIIPQDIIGKGQDFDRFIQFLAEKLKNY